MSLSSTNHTNVFDKANEGMGSGIRGSTGHDDPGGHGVHIVLKIILTVLSTVCFLYVCYQNSRVRYVVRPEEDDGDHEKGRTKQLLELQSIVLTEKNFPNKPEAAGLSNANTDKTRNEQRNDRLAAPEQPLSSFSDTTKDVLLGSSSAEPAVGETNDANLTALAPPAPKATGTETAASKDREAPSGDASQDSDHDQVMPEPSSNDLAQETGSGLLEESGGGDDSGEGDHSGRDNGDVIAIMPMTASNNGAESTCKPATDERHLQQNLCAICLSEYRVGETIVVGSSTCNHAFHLQCMEQWLFEKGPECPTCRGSFINPDHDSQDNEEGNSDNV